ncbi:MAG: hypothetical protein LBK01_03155, partial [Burkholderiaceae bacterium]|nr:hypothetical protein [Burkholderiaceae bacterium]
KESLTWGTGDGLSCENCDSEVPLSTNADGDFVCMACGMVAAPGNDWEAVEGAQEVCPRCGGRMSGTAEDAYCKNCAELGGMASL